MFQYEQDGPTGRQVLQIEDVLGNGAQADELGVNASTPNYLEILVDRGTVLYDADGKPDEDNQYRFSAKATVRVGLTL